MYKRQLFSQYRREEGVFEGHPSNLAPGVEWCNGCLGQGLSQGVGTALALGLRKREGAHVYVLMGDGERSKGQLQEAIELAAKYRLSRLTAIVDMNGQQSSGTTVSYTHLEKKSREWWKFAKQIQTRP